jgi:hypothetical protein
MDAGWAPVRALVPSLLRGLVAAGVAALLAYPLVRVLTVGEELSVLEGLAAAALGGLTTVAAFLGVAYLLRAPELRDLLRRG